MEWTPYSAPSVDGETTNWTHPTIPGFIVGPFRWMKGGQGWAWYSAPEKGYHVAVLTSQDGNTQYHGVPTLDEAVLLAQRAWDNRSPGFNGFKD